MRRLGTLIVSLLLLASPTFAQAADTNGGQLRLTPAEITALATTSAKAGTSGVTGIQTRVLSGDPSQPGLYTIEIRVPANTRIQAHTHKDPRTATVISGTWFFGYGEVAGDALVKALPPGSFYREPQDAPHFALTRQEPAVVQITGWGPTDTVYVDPAKAPKP